MKAQLEFLGRQGASQRIPQPRYWPEGHRWCSVKFPLTLGATGRPSNSAHLVLLRGPQTAITRCFKVIYFRSPQQSHTQAGRRHPSARGPATRGESHRSQLAAALLCTGPASTAGITKPPEESGPPLPCKSGSNQAIAARCGRPHAAVPLAGLEHLKAGPAFESS
ncbi:hypothetical protein NDU88_001788 [Pleurodeles waltl]|uniref:Uncharacterized protein n=1 Tax=Pleurodeles waltl TaxID=8319 RepID=A0AAV7M0A8_PLEWA|nr:hypothetical protein NDU88_001788 [Pleurodeles waltl]